MKTAIAKHKFARMSAQKARLVADQIRSLSVARAVELLKFSDKKAASLIKKCLDSAIANAENNSEMDIDRLIVSKIFIDEAVRMRRWHARAKGRGCRIIKRTCHINVVVSERS